MILDERVDQSVDGCDGPHCRAAIQRIGSTLYRHPVHLKPGADDGVGNPLTVCNR